LSGGEKGEGTAESVSESYDIGEAEVPDRSREIKVRKEVCAAGEPFGTRKVEREERSTNLTRLK